MPISLRLDEARNQLIFLAGIDGKTGANARYSTTNLNALVNRKYRELRSRVSRLGMPHFVQTSAAAPIPVLTTGEDFSDIPMPAGIGDVIGIDVQTNRGYGGLRWQKLDGLDFSQRRDIQNLEPEHGVGFWAVHQAPVPSGTAITAGKIAVWGAPTYYSPGNALAGNYVLHSVDVWADITVDANVFMLYEGWDEWFLNAAAMTCCQRDKDKRDLYEQAKEAWQAADALIVTAASRLQRTGHVSPTPYGGICL